MEIDLKEIYYVSLSFEFLHLKNEPKKKTKPPIAVPSSTETDRVPRKNIPMHIIRPWLSFLMYIIH